MVEKGDGRGGKLRNFGADVHRVLRWWHARTHTHIRCVPGFSPFLTRRSIFVPKFVNCEGNERCDRVSTMNDSMNRFVNPLPCSRGRYLLARSHRCAALRWLARERTRYRYDDDLRRKPAGIERLPEIAGRRLINAPEHLFLGPILTTVRRTSRRPASRVRDPAALGATSYEGVSGEKLSFIALA